MKIGEYTVIQNPHMTERVFTRMQTRKFKNTRWVKKYVKKYSKLIPQKNIFISDLNKTIICHPSVYDQLRLEIAIQDSIKRDFGGNINLSATGGSSSVVNAFRIEPRLMFYGIKRPEYFLNVITA